MRWSRFALGILPAVPAVIVAVVVLAMGGPETEETGATTARIDLEGPSPQGPSSARPRALTRPRATTMVRAPSRAGGSEASASDSQVKRCCDDLTRYRRATPHRYRELYDEILGICKDIGAPGADGDDAVMLAKVQDAMKEREAPYIPPGCR
jgi:hypothetical protein